MKSEIRTLAITLAACMAMGAVETPLHQRQARPSRAWLTGGVIYQIQARPSPAWLTGGVIYQIQPRAFTPEGTLKAAQARLPRLAELGVTVLYLCPIFVADDDMDQAFWSPRQKKSGMNNPRNPYRMKDFYHVDPEYGTDQDLKDFVAAAHALKLRVMLDMVYLHCGPKAVFIASNPDFVKRADDGKVKNAGWSFPGLNFASAGLREYLWKNMEWWIRDFDVDGFRCDVADQIPLDFWEEGRARIERIKPDVGMLAEGTRKVDQLKAFDLDYGWGGAFAQLQDGAAIRKLWTTMRDQRPRGGAKFVRFIDNHDIANDDYNNRLEKRWGAARVEAALVWLFTMDGVPFLYNGQEVADAARHSIFGRAPIDWANGGTEAGKARFAFVQSLCALRKSEPALTRGDLVWLDTDQPETVSAFARTLQGTRIVSVINLSGQPVKVTVKGAEGGLTPLLTRDAKGVGQTECAIGPHGFFVGKAGPF